MYFYLLFIVLLSFKSFGKNWKRLDMQMQQSFKNVSQHYDRKQHESCVRSLAHKILYSMDRLTGDEQLLTDVDGNQMNLRLPTASFEEKHLSIMHPDLHRVSENSGKLFKSVGAFRGK